MLGGPNCGFIMPKFQEVRWEGNFDNSGIKVLLLADGNK